MMLVYDVKGKHFIPAAETDFKSNDILERKNIESWVMAHPELLGEDLLIITNEYDRFDKTNERLDLLALDKDGKLVIIELKRDDSGKYVDLQAVKYAAYCSTLTMDEIITLRKKFAYKNKNASDEDVKKEIQEFVEVDLEQLDDKPRILLVSKEFKPEVTASVLWLRKFELDISCIKLTPYKIDDGKIGIVSNIIIPLPEAEDYLIKAERKENTENALNRLQREYLEFYTDVIRRFGVKVKTTLPGLPEPKPRYYIQFSSGHPGILFEWLFKGNPRSAFAVGIDFEIITKKENQRYLKEFENNKEEIENLIGEKVTFENAGKYWRRMYIVKNEGQVTEELKEWAAEKMATLYTICKPKLDKISHQ